jgi:hypothetical protein
MHLFRKILMRIYILFFLAASLTCQADTKSNLDINGALRKGLGPCAATQMGTSSSFFKCIDAWEKKHKRAYDEVYGIGQQPISGNTLYAPSFPDSASNGCLSENKLRQVLRDFGLREENYTDANDNKYLDGSLGPNVEDYEHKKLLEESRKKVHDAYNTYRDSILYQSLKENLFKSQLERHKACMADKDAC